MYGCSHVTKKKDNFPLGGMAITNLFLLQKWFLPQQSMWHFNLSRKKIEGISKRYCHQTSYNEIFFILHLVMKLNLLAQTESRVPASFKMTYMQKKQVHQQDQHILRALQTNKIAVALFYFSSNINMSLFTSLYLSCTRDPYFLQHIKLWYVF